MKELYRSYRCGGTRVIYIVEDGVIGMVLVPEKRAERFLLNKDCAVEPLIQAKIEGDKYANGFAQGRTMRGSETTGRMRLSGQEMEGTEHGMLIRTIQADSRGIEYEHLLRYNGVSRAFEVEVTVKNRSGKRIVLEYLSSFTLVHLTPFADRAEPGQLILHRLLSTWSAEGRLKSEPLEELQLEPSWQKYSANSLRYGQRGSMPVREYVPFVAVEDRQAGVTWAAVTTQGSSWQIEASRKDEGLVISGGLADMEFGHWRKQVDPGESFHAPKAVIAVMVGDVTAAAQRIAENVRQYMPLPETERHMPVVFNEFCSTWGHPTQESIKYQLEALKGTGIRYFVIDAGWYINDDAEGDTRLGEWEVGAARFPEGMEQTVERIRKAGMLPGIWFEFEISGEDSDLFEMTSWELHRNGFPVTAGKRRFWDFRKKEVREYLAEKVIGFLKKYGFSYLKVDYNGNIGIGCDGAESQGEGLRQQIAAVQDFFTEYMGKSRIW